MSTCQQFLKINLFIKKEKVEIKGNRKDVTEESGSEILLGNIRHEFIYLYLTLFQKRITKGG